MFELHISETEVTSGTIPVAWCISKATLKKIATRQIKNPQVVLCTAPMNNYHFSKETRKIVPLQDLMAYVEFRAPGPNKIYGWITSLSKDGEDGAASRYLSRTSRAYDTDICIQSSYANGSEGSLEITTRCNDDAIGGVYSLEVDVPKECFAKEAPEWEKTWVNHLFKYKPIDQCDYRRRRMLAYTIQPILMIFNLLFRVIMLLSATILCCRNITTMWYRSFKLLTYSLGDTLEMFGGGSLLILKHPKTTRNVESVKGMTMFLAKYYWPVPLTPAIQLLLLFFIYKQGLLAVLMTLGWIVVGIVAVLLIIVLLANKEEIANWLSGDKLWYEDENETSLLICNNNPKPTKVTELPSSRRTIKLRFMELKSKVCRPFAG